MMGMLDIGDIPPGPPGAPMVLDIGAWPPGVPPGAAAGETGSVNEPPAPLLDAATESSPVGGGALMLQCIGRFREFEHSMKQRQI